MRKISLTVTKTITFAFKISRAWKQKVGKKSGRTCEENLLDDMHAFLHEHIHECALTFTWYYVQTGLPKSKHKEPLKLQRQGYG